MNDPEFLAQEVQAVVDLLGLHALGRLDAADAERVRLAAGRSELVALLLVEAEQAAAALDQTDGKRVLAAPPQPPPDLEERVVAGIRRHRNGQRLQRVAAGAAACVVAVGLFAAGRVTVPTPPAPPLEEVVFTVEREVDVLDADLINHTWGTELVMRVTDVVPGDVYTVEFVTADGRTVDAGSFLGVDEGPVDCRMNAAILRDDVVQLRVRDAAGTPVLQSDLG